MNEHEKYMSRALELASQGRGRVEPNPMVGAVIVRDGKVLGQGFHEKFGGPHAEVTAIENAGECAGATLYLTLEPCHHKGKTPPCTDAILKAGISNVVCAMKDPNPAVKGGGASFLREKGVKVAFGVLENEARQLNAPYIKFVTHRRPYVISKWAMTLDGKIATRTGDSKWITDEVAREYAHRLRSQCDAVLVGDGTLRRDDPRLSARIPGGRSPARCVVSPVLDVPGDCQIVTNASEVDTYFFTTSAAPEKKREFLEKQGATVVNADAKDRPGVFSLDAMLAYLAGKNVTNLLVEGGGITHAQFFEAGQIDRLYCFVAPKIVGGSKAPTPIGGKGLAYIGEALSLKNVQIEMFEGSILVTGTLTEY